MSVPSGKEIFETYLSNLEYEIGEGKHDAVPADEELHKHYGDYLQDTLSPNYNDPALEHINDEAWAAYDIDMVKNLY